MKYEFLEDIAIADVAFKAYGKTLEELFENCAEAVFEVMVGTLRVDVRGGKWEMRLKNKNLDGLLYDFLSELVALKDEESVIFGKFEVKIKKDENAFRLNAKVYGDKIDPERHELRIDVKAVTMHLFEVKKVKTGYQATVVLDI